MKILGLLLLLIFCSSIALAVELPVPVIPNPEAFLGWSKKPYEIDELDFSKVRAKPFACTDKTLTPLSADQSTKRYHKYVVGSYNHAKLRANSEACAVSSKTGYCLRADTTEYVIMSDTYVDKCGNSYRGFWEVNFLTQNESMGTLCSLGRTFYEKANSEFPGEIEIGPIYEIQATRFLFFTDLKSPL